ncbi:hypothetical protein T439DRAFT_345004 [Meredithblackwellia eburnea MCA 4105]
MPSSSPPPQHQLHLQSPLSAMSPHAPAADLVNSDYSTQASLAPFSSTGSNSLRPRPSRSTSRSSEIGLIADEDLQSLIRAHQIPSQPHPYTLFEDELEQDTLPEQHITTINPNVIIAIADPPSATSPCSFLYPGVVFKGQQLYVPYSKARRQSPYTIPPQSAYYRPERQATTTPSTYNPPPPLYLPNSSSSPAVHSRSSTSNSSNTASTSTSTPADDYRAARRRLLTTSINSQFPTLASIPPPFSSSVSATTLTPLISTSTSPPPNQASASQPQNSLAADEDLRHLLSPSARARARSSQDARHVRGSVARTLSASLGMDMQVSALEGERMEGGEERDHEEEDPFEEEQEALGRILENAFGRSSTSDLFEPEPGEDESVSGAGADSGSSNFRTVLASEVRESVRRSLDEFRRVTLRRSEVGVATEADWEMESSEALRLTTETAAAVVARRMGLGSLIGQQQGESSSASGNSAGGTLRREIRDIRAVLDDLEERRRRRRRAEVRRRLELEIEEVGRVDSNVSSTASDIRRRDLLFGNDRAVRSTVWSDEAGFAPDSFDVGLDFGTVRSQRPSFHGEEEVEEENDDDSEEDGDEDDDDELLVWPRRSRSLQFSFSPDVRRYLTSRNFFVSDSPPPNRQRAIHDLNSPPPNNQHLHPRPHHSPDSQHQLHQQHSKDEHWSVRVIIQSYSPDSRSLTGLMHALGVPDSSAQVTTFFRGEVVDPASPMGIYTHKWGARKKDDVDFWARLGPFKAIEKSVFGVRVADPEWLRRTCEGWVLMRWKEADFVNVTPAESMLSISGFYLVALHRATGQLEGLYYDPSSNLHGNGGSFQRLVLSAAAPHAPFSLGSFGTR